MSCRLWYETISIFGPQILHQRLALCIKRTSPLVGTRDIVHVEHDSGPNLCQPPNINEEMQARHPREVQIQESYRWRQV